ncbi:MAG TPA: ROK family protein [Anaerolineae bacterium]|nr:ROK family protein [Anaerolineae bacterium]HIQ06728.1 ROK family protein [Anaerolineae bacterium]
MEAYIVGVDLGGTQIRAAISDAEGHIYRKEAALTEAEEGPEAVLQRIQALIEQVVADTDWEQIRAIGVSAPGPLNPWTGVIIQAPNLPGWHNVPLRDILMERFQCPTWVGNDANVAALAEQQFGAGRGINDLIYITVSTGIGGGVITNGQLLLGSDGLGAELGHMTVEANGIRCNCGNVGCVETLASGPAIARHAVEGLKAGAKSKVLELVQGDLSKVTARIVNEAAQAGDEFAIAEFKRAGFYLGVAFVNLAYIFNPRMIIVGGGVTKAGALLFEPAWKTIRDRLPRPYWEKLAIVPPALGDDVCLLGGVALAATECK